MSKISSFKSVENKRDMYRGKGLHDKTFCESLRVNAMKLILKRKK